MSNKFTSVLRKLGQEDHKFQARLGYIARPCLTMKTNKVFSRGKKKNIIKKVLLPLRLSIVVTKNNHLTKGGKKGAKKNTIDPLSKRGWYDVKVPAERPRHRISAAFVLSLPPWPALRISKGSGA
jgi:hypothetical protein